MRKYFTVSILIIAVAVAFGEGFVFAEEAVSASPRIDHAVDAKIPIFRHSTYPEAWTAAQKSNRPILVYISMPNCPYCVKMVEKTYGIPAVENLVSSSFETVYAGRFSHAKLVQMLKVKWYPTTVLVGPNNKVLDVIEGYVDSKTFQRRLQTGLAAAASPTRTR